MVDKLDSLLGPLARFLVAQSIAFPDFAERMKLHYVRAAEAASGDKATDSRISVQTGLQRRDIARLRAAEVRKRPPNHLAQLIALWMTDPGYGQGATLPRNGPAPSFEALASMVRKDIHPRTFLDALLAVEAVALEGEGAEVRLMKQSYQPLPGSEDQIAYLVANMGDHLAAAVDNVTGHTPAHFERAVHYGRLTEAEVEELREEFAAAQMEVLQALGRRAAEMKRTGCTGSQRFRAGGYFYQHEGDAE